ncbi:MAG: 4-alpha-glucanotransferase [Clostridia bacterium]|nr:4-alpha-glucanotransferase [Clostridia bacterium]
MKEKGILLPIFSLPSKYGIGDFGYEAYEFIDILSENNISYWEILPINAHEESPYSPISYYALESKYLSLDKLKEDGLIKAPETRENKDRALYDDFKEKYYKEAFSNFKKDSKYDKFIKTKEINEYADFMQDEKGEDREYILFIQYILHKQWMELKKYANKKNVKIIGDMPVYPVFNSAETKYHPECFEMKDGKFTYEAGTPPDYFNSDGQKWNSPVYNVENIKKKKCKYLIKRFEYQLKLFDKIRIDYFRGYDSFFKIPIGKSGKEGFYSDGLSYVFFDELLKSKKVKKENLIIEDLGDIREETVALREHYNFTRQKILQFTIDFNNLIDRDNDAENVLVFPGNHDCNTIYGWYKTLSEEYKQSLKEFLKRNNCNNINVNIGIMQYLIKCKAQMAIIMVQDVLGLDESARINMPGTISNENWSWKLIDFTDFKERIKDFN